MCFLCNSKSSPWSSRRAFLLAAGAATGSAAIAQVDVGKSSEFRKLVPAAELEAAAAQQYVQTLGEACLLYTSWWMPSSRSSSASMNE